MSAHQTVNDLEVWLQQAGSWWPTTEVGEPKIVVDVSQNDALTLNEAGDLIAALVALRAIGTAAALGEGGWTRDD